jgi:hypothetical protein
MIVKKNPYTNQPHVDFKFTEAELGDMIKDYDEAQFNKIPKDISCSFEFGVAFFVFGAEKVVKQNRAENFKDLSVAIPEYGTMAKGFEYWVSELIQNAHDAKWLMNNKEVGATEFCFDIAEDSFAFSHNGRPPQFINWENNEVGKLTKQSTSKHNQYSTEGEFGIGFKLWMMLFNKIELSFGSCTLVIQITKDGQEFTMDWDDHNKHKLFTIKASEPKGNFLQEILDSSSDGLQAIFKRSIRGNILRPHPFSITIKLPKMKEVVKKSEVKYGEEDSKFKMWEVQASEQFNLPKRLITYTEEIRALMSSDDIKENLAKEIEADERRKTILEKDDATIDIAEVIENTINDFDITIAIVPDEPFEGALFSSLFPIPGPNKEYISSSGLCFVGKFSLDQARQQLRDDTAGKSARNNILMYSFLECYYLVMSEISNIDTRNKLKITDEYYLKLLQTFTQTESDDGMKYFVQKISTFLSGSEYRENVKEIISLLGVYPQRNGEFGVYNTMIDAREELMKLVESEDDTLKAWGLSLFEKSESIFTTSSSEYKKYHWMVPSWNSHRIFPNWKNQSGPKDITLSEFVNSISELDIGWPSWLNVPVLPEKSDILEWKSNKELEGHFIYLEMDNDVSREETLTIFEQKIKDEASVLGLEEYTIPLKWITHAGGGNERIQNLITDVASTFKKRVSYLAKYAEIPSKLMHDICIEHPQEKAQFPFFFFSTDDNKIIVLEKEIPTSVLFSKGDNKLVVNCKIKPDGDFKMLSTYRYVVKSFPEREDRITHLYYGKLGETFSTDLSNLKVNHQENLCVEPPSHFNLGEEFNPVCVKFPPGTPDDIKDSALKWINKTPHIASIFKLTPQHVTETFETSKPSNFRQGEGNDSYILVNNDTSEDEILNPPMTPALAQQVIDTYVWAEANLKSNPQSWDNRVRQGKCSVLLRIASYPAVVAEQLVRQYSYSGCIKFLRGLTFNHMPINPTYVYLSLGNLFIKKAPHRRRIRIITRKLLPSNLATIEHGADFMNYLAEKHAYIGTLPEEPSANLQKFLKKKPNYNAKIGSIKTLASLWNLESDKLAAQVFRFALANGNILLSQTILYNSEHLDDNPNKFKMIHTTLGTKNREFIKSDDYPLKNNEWHFHFFKHYTKKRKSLFRELLEAIVDGDYDDETLMLLTSVLEGVTLAVHRHRDQLADEMREAYWQELANFGYGSHIHDKVPLSQEFKELLELRTNYSRNIESFLQLADHGFTDFAGGIKSLKDNGFNNKRKLAGDDLGRNNLPITSKTHIYLVKEKEHQSCFPLTTNRQMLSASSKVFSEKASLVLFPEDDEYDVLKELYNEQTEKSNLKSVIEGEIKNILDQFCESLSSDNNKGTPPEDHQFEFLRRLVLRYVSSKLYQPGASSTLEKQLRYAYHRINIKQLDTNEAMNEQMFQGIKDEYLGNILIGSCGLGFSFKKNVLTLTLGPWLNQEMGHEKLYWLDDLFGNLLAHNTGINKRNFEEAYKIERENLNFLHPRITNGLQNHKEWLDQSQDTLLERDARFHEFFSAKSWRNYRDSPALIEQIRSQIATDIKAGRLPDSGSNVFEQMYNDGSYCCISGYVEPSVIGVQRRHRVRLRRPTTTTSPPVMKMDDVKGWKSIGNTLWVSPTAAAEGEIHEGWRLLSPEGIEGHFVDHLLSSLQNLYNVAQESDYLVIDDVIGFQDEDGHPDHRFSLKIHKLHALYLIAYDKYCETEGLT